eukprot:TRINITY_DN24378_c0_g1_i1.p1 TRINITY_DN24378_c0_g1~~TRINITY_DN24378_c0_g1_i1.p1  ORF type:complete len:244 (-),score=45.55 TRINITY_DN24378_c0_g1_i1:200-898(-)
MAAPMLAPPTVNTMLLPLPSCPFGTEPITPQAFLACPAAASHGAVAVANDVTPLSSNMYATPTVLGPPAIVVPASPPQASRPVAAALQAKPVTADAALKSSLLPGRPESRACSPMPHQCCAQETPLNASMPEVSVPSLAASSPPCVVGRDTEASQVRVAWRKACMVAEQILNLPANRAVHDQVLGRCRLCGNSDSRNTVVDESMLLNQKLVCSVDHAMSTFEQFSRRPAKGF